MSTVVRWSSFCKLLSDPATAQPSWGEQASFPGNKLRLVSDRWPSSKGEKSLRKHFYSLLYYYIISVQGDRHWNIISLSKPVMASWVKITVKAVYGTVNNGFKEIQIFGCWDWFVKALPQANRFSNQLVLDYFNKSVVCIRVAGFRRGKKCHQFFRQTRIS